MSAEPGWVDAVRWLGPLLATGCVLLVGLSVRLLTVPVVGVSGPVAVTVDVDPPSVTDRLFERFVQGDGSITRRFGGSGLGLSICRATIEAHGGSIEAQASPLGGLRMTITLPLAASA